MYGHWVIGEDFDPDAWFGFTYLITNLQTGRKYIGRKQLRARNRKVVKGRKNRKVCVSDSNWKEYTSSCDELKEDIARLGKENFSFTIIKLCRTKRELGYSEVQEQFAQDVLNAKLENGERAYYNSNIMSRWFVGPEKHSEKTIQKMQKPKTEDWKRKIGESNRGNKRPDLVERNRSGIGKKYPYKARPTMVGNQNANGLKGYKQSPEHIAKRALAQTGKPGHALGKTWKVTKIME
jgi:hypothetical protein